MEVFDILEAARGGEECLLIHGDGETVARLDYEGTDDFPWIYFRFSPLPAWDRLGPDRLVFQSRQGLNPLEVIERRIVSIQRMDLWLSTADGRIRVGDFLFWIQQGLAYFRSYPRGESISNLRGRRTD